MACPMFPANIYEFLKGFGTFCGIVAVRFQLSASSSVHHDENAITFFRKYLQYVLQSIR